MRIGEDPDLSMTIWENGYQTAFFDDIVYHKRRTDLGKFSKQVYQFGCAKTHSQPKTSQLCKPTFGFLHLFLLGYVAEF